MSDPSRPGGDGPPSRWLVVSVRPPGGEDGEVVAEELLRAGGRAVAEEDGRLVTHLPDPEDPTRVVADLRRSLSVALGAPDVDLRTSWQPHEDWAELWKRGLSPRRVGDRIMVAPSWSRPHPAPGDLVIVIDPGMAFGTAEHGTTRGCLRLLSRAVAPGDRVVDVGAGSGILSIAAARLGATEVLALEGDPWAVEPARENVEANGVAASVEVLQTWADARSLATLGPRDGVVANIETRVLQDLLPGFHALLRSGGWLILSGITDHEWEGMAEAVVQADFALEAVDEDGEWRSGLFRHRSSTREPGPHAGALEHEPMPAREVGG